MSKLKRIASWCEREDRGDYMYQLHRVAYCMRDEISALRADRERLHSECAGAIAEAAEIIAHGADMPVDEYLRRRDAWLAKWVTQPTKEQS